jgi:hypothetical protein
MHPVAGLPPIFPQAVRVMAFFPPARRAHGKYRMFEYLIFLQDNGTSAACRRAVSILRAVHDDPEELEKLGPPIQPSFYAVVWACVVELPGCAAVPFEHPMVINHLTLEVQEVEALKAQAKACFPVSLEYLEE